METNDPSLRPGRHAAAMPDRRPVSRRELRAAERREISAAEFADTVELPAAPHVDDPGERRSGVVARRTALSMAGSGVALVGIAIAAHKAPDGRSLDEATRDIVAGASNSKAESTPSPTPPTRAQTEYQVAASGRAPAADQRAARQP